ncbi:Tat pathway signal protein [Streptomyces sp. NPDC058252]|uniref:golvesin C-terminal-like domain-containing protein n=1 Tax=Streptomyces sp. NPDC058252 TaxID=3346405 RepID=UPI0036EC16CE
MRLRRRPHIPLAALVACAALTSGLLQVAPASAHPGHSDGKQASAPAATGGVKNPDQRLGKGWKSSTDRAVTSAADTAGFRILVADSAKAYAWQTQATLAEPGMPADSWIGNQCVMDRDHAAVVYAPRAYTNKPDLMQGGAFTAIVDLHTGQVTKLAFTASLAYFDPSCNPQTHTATFSAYRDDKTRLVTVDTRGKTVADAAAAGQITSGVPVEDGAVGARGHHLVHIDKSGTVRDLAATNGVPYEIRPSGKGRAAFLDPGRTTAQVKLWRGRGKPAVAASGRLGDLSLKQGEAHRVFLTGHPDGQRHTNGTGVTVLNAPAEADVSTLGRLAVDTVLTPGVKAGLARINNAGKGFTKAEPAPAQARTHGNGGAAEPVIVTSTATATGQKVSQSVTRAGTRRGDQALSPSLSGSTSTAHTSRAAAGSGVSHNPVDTDRWCSVPRNDVNAQALQPTPNQVEWAIDLAVRGELRAKWVNQGGWRSQTGLGTIDPQGMFPPPTLKGGGRIPAQVMLGVLAQESNLWQAEPGVIPGQMGSPLAATAGFYGHKGSDPADYWKIHWDKSDCGYGVGQVTDGMRLAGHEKPGETSLPPATQKAVALDYSVNVAASMYILADKWNELHTSGQTITVNNDDPSRPENWFAELWNYNLGFNRVSDASKNNGHWGLGWYNNPANPFYPASRLPFMDTSVDPNASRDAAHPQDWPYEEKVMGWSAWSIDTGHSYSTDGRQDWPGESGFSSAGFRPSWWVDAGQRSKIKPPLDAFCNTANHCSVSSPPDCPDAACYQQYWWNGSNVTWKKDCATTCGHEDIKYATLRAEPGRGYRLQYGTPVCSGAPSGSLVVESDPAGTDTWSDCGKTKTDGSFEFTFRPDSDGQYEAKGDLFQIGGGYQGHFWYAHERDKDHLGGPTGPLTVLGTWRLNKPVAEKQAKVYVHIPDTGAQTKQAVYEIDTAEGIVKKTIDQSANESHSWVSLGAYRFNDKTPQVRLSNTTGSGTADKDIAWDAAAFVPGDYGIPDAGVGGLVLPDADDNAEDVDFVDDDKEKQPNPDGVITTPLPGLIGSAEGGKAQHCVTKDGLRECVTNTTAVDPSLFARAPRLAPGVAGPNGTLVTWCGTDPSVSGYTLERREACLMFAVLISVDRVDNGKVTHIGDATFLVRHETKLANSYKNTMREILAVSALTIDSTLGTVSLESWNSDCAPNCKVEYSSSWDGSTTWTGLPDHHWAAASKTTTWTKPDEGTEQTFDRKFWLDFKPSAATGSLKITQPTVTYFSQVRCDNSVYVNNSTGCVFEKHIPKFTLNTAKYPVAAAYYWLLREQLPSHPGSEKEKKPLHREIDDSVRRSNRNTICPTSWQTNSKATPEITKPGTSGVDCDEFPFAATKESGGRFVQNGEECVQLYAQKSTDGKWRLYYDERYSDPTWKELCGRASMSAKQNQGLGGRLGNFYSKARVADDDAFYIEAPGLEGCAIGEVCEVRP